MPLGSAKHRSERVVRSSPTRAQRGTRPKRNLHLNALSTFTA
ncbi:MAG: hypothetical protein NZ455_16155 [Bacteroidia bacterium]|nr:hypothetical protein [Bacteroidia bacterium]